MEDPPDLQRQATVDSCTSCPAAAVLPKKDDDSDEGFSAFLEFLKSPTPTKLVELEDPSSSGTVDSSCASCIPATLTKQDDAPCKIEIGSVVPDFCLKSVDGSTIKLSDFRGQKIMVCFYLFSHCGVCAYAIGDLVGEYKKLAWASKLKVITIFRTDVENLRAGLTSANSPIPKLALDESGAYPFVALADPQGHAASLFDCQRNTLLNTLRMNHKSIPTMCKNLCTNKLCRKEALFAARHGAGNLMPSEFLIDERGVLVDAMRATKSHAHFSTTRISRFLLLGERCTRSVSWLP